MQAVGRAFVSLQNLLHDVPIEHELTVVNEVGVACGKLRVSVQSGQRSTADSTKANVDERTVDFSDFRAPVSATSASGETTTGDAAELEHSDGLGGAGPRCCCCLPSFSRVFLSCLSVCNHFAIA